MAASRDNGDQVRDEQQGELKELAAKIRKGHQQVLEALRTGVEQARLTGNFLIRAKDLVPKGEWTVWVKKNCSFTMQEAQRYMRLARGWQELKDAGNDPEEMTLTEALSLLSHLNGTAKPMSDGPDESAFDLTPAELKDRRERAMELRDERLTFTADSTEHAVVEQLIARLFGSLRKKAVELSGDEDPVPFGIMLFEQLQSSLRLERLVLRKEEVSQPANADGQTPQQPADETSQPKVAESDEPQPSGKDAPHRRNGQTKKSQAA